MSTRRSNLAELADHQQRTTTVTFIPDPEPDELFCPIVSVDDHVLEPPHTFVGRMPAQYAADGPHVETDADGVPWWILEDKRMPILFANGAAGRVLEEWKGASRCSYQEFRPSVSEPITRLADMDVAGIWASLCFGSTLWGFAGSRFARIKDPALGLASLRAYNDWMIDEWCATDRARFIPCQLPWLRDPEVAAGEIRRNAARGFRAVSFSENPEGLGFASIYDTSWDPFFAACAETETIVNLHVGSSGRTPNPSADSPPEAIAALFPLSGMETVVDWIYAKVPIRHPELQVVLSEAGVSWVPMIIERLRRAYRHLPASEIWARDDPDPIELLHRNFHFASLEDPSGFRMLDIIGEDRVMVETDFPHMDSTWPGCQAMIRGELAHLSRDVIAKVCFENACRLYRHPLPPSDLIARAMGAGMSPFSVDGKRILVTGGSHGIGAMIAGGFVDAGARVVICGRDEAAISDRARDLSARGTCCAITADVSSEAGCRALADAYAQHVDGIDVLVNNAGGASMRPFEEFDEEAWESVLAVNLKGVSHLTRFLLPMLRATARDDVPSRVINIGSISGERVGELDNYAYTSSKAALHHFTKHLARRLAPDITVNAIAPGPFESRMMAPILERHGDAIAKTVPLQRIGAPEDIAAAAIYLASPAGSWVTGTVLTVDGGVSLT